jgi:hypothetical protein
VSRVFTSAIQVQRLTESLEVRDLDGTSLGAVLGLHADVLPRGLLTAGASARFSARRHGTLVVSGDLPTGVAAERGFSFGVPADVSVGLASQPLPGLTVAAEAQWIGYSRVSSDPLPVVSYKGVVAGSDLSVLALADLARPGDVVVPRFGVEYVASADRLRLAFRLGYHREPAHGVTADLVARDASGTGYEIVDPPYSSAVRKVFDGGRPDDRFSGGFGATLDRRVSIDLSFDLGRASRQISASVFYRF